MDIAKSIAIVFMVLVHLFEELLPYERQVGVWRGVIYSVLGSPFAAPIFMFCLGVGIVYTRSNQPKQLMKRGWSILVIGLVLNIMRFVIPMGTMWQITKDNYYFEYVYENFFSVDILQFSGLVFFFFALVKRMKISNMYLAVIGILCSFAGGLLVDLSTGSYAADVVTGLFYRSYESSYFPFLSWIIFPIAGYIMGQYFSKVEDRSAFYKRYSLPCGIVAIALFTMAAIGEQWSFGEDSKYYGMGLDQGIGCLFFIVGIMGVYYWMGTVLSAPIMKIAGIMAKDLNRIYCISWVIIVIIECFFNYYDYTTFPMLGLIPLCAAVTIVTVWLARWKGKKILAPAMNR